MYRPISFALRRGDAIEGRLDRGDLLGDHLDDHPPPVRRIGDPPDVARLLEAVDDAGDRAGGEARDLRQPAGRGGAHVDELLEGLDVGLGQAEADRHGLAEERALEVDPPKRAEDGIDVLRFMVDNGS